MIILIIIVILLIIIYKWNNRMEHFYDVVPYEAHWNIFKCNTQDCIRNRGYECYKWCNNISQQGALENCKMRCADYSDQQFDYLKFQNYTWNGINRHFDEYSALNNDNDFVMKKGVKKFDKLVK